MTVNDLSLERRRLPVAVTLRHILRGLGLLPDPGTWIDPACAVLVCAYPRSRRALGRLRQLGIRRLLNLHERRHACARLAEFGLMESHLPVADFAAPTPSQLETAMGIIRAELRAGDRVAVHCGGGLGRAGTVAACYLVELGQDWRTAVAQIRALRPGAIETRAQLASVAAHAERVLKLAQGAV